MPTANAVDDAPSLATVIDVFTPRVSHAPTSDATTTLYGGSASTTAPATLGAKVTRIQRRMDQLFSRKRAATASGGDGATTTPPTTTASTKATTTSGRYCDSIQQSNCCNFVDVVGVCSVFFFVVIVNVIDVVVINVFDNNVNDSARQTQAA